MKNFKKNPIGQPKPVLSLCPGTLLSLLDIMRELDVHKLVVLLGEIQECDQELARLAETHLARKHADHIRARFELFCRFFDELEWDEPKSRVWVLLTLLAEGSVLSASATGCPSVESVRTALKL